MRAQCVEVNAPLLNEYPRFDQAGEQLPAKELISKLAVKALAISVLPRAARRDVGGVGAQALWLMDALNRRHKKAAKE